MTNRIPIVRPSWDAYFLDIAKVVATRSHDAETQVGAVLVDKNHRIISTGYNGFPPGVDDNSLPNCRPDKYPYMLHAEINAIASCAHDLRGSTLYLTLSPCKECAKAIAAAGIVRVVYRQPYVNDDFVFVSGLMEKCGIAFVQA